MSSPSERAAEAARAWTLDPACIYLNHGSFGACPRAVLDLQAELRAAMERQPMHFFMRGLLPRLAAARDEIAAFVGAEPEGLAFVRNATAGFNVALRHLARRLELGPGDRLLSFDHGYPACQNALEAVAAETGAEAVCAPLPFLGATIEQIEAAVLGALSAETRLVVLDHITSPTALVLPVARLVPALKARGVAVLIDGAHAPGMVELDLASLGADFYVANLHKWVCAPKGAAILYASPAHRNTVLPLSVSHGYSMPAEATGFGWMHQQFHWPGTDDPSPWLCAPVALKTLAALHPDGWPGVRAHNRALALEARAILAPDARELPDEALIGSMAAIPLPDEPIAEGAPRSRLDIGPLQMALVQQGFEAPVVTWPEAPRRLIRVSAQLYNHPAQYVALGAALKTALADELR